MINYLTFNKSDVKDNTIEKIYIALLNSKSSFAIIKTKEENYILTKERSIFKINDIDNFIKDANDDIYFKTIYSNNNDYLKEDLNLYYEYLNKYKDKMNKKYGSKYLFGCVAVKTKNNNIITSIRGKENLDEFTIVTGVDYVNHIVYVNNKKATLNAPLLYKILEIDNIKTIVHINQQYNDELPYLPYAFPGTEKDSLRIIKKSFNISYHGLFMLFNNNNKMIGSDDNE